MPQEVLNIIYAALGVIITSLAGWGVAIFKNWVSSKIKDKHLAELVTRTFDIITDAVKSVYQTFVESLKAEGKFTKEAQAEAKEKALEIIKSRFTPDIVDYVKENYGDLEAWVNTQIEAVLYNLKNKNK